MKSFHTQTTQHLASAILQIKTHEATSGASKSRCLLQQTTYLYSIVVATYLPTHVGNHCFIPTIE